MIVTRPEDRPQLESQPLWSPTLRGLAVGLWAGFLGASALLLLLVASWDGLLRHAVPGFGLLSLLFAICWLTCAGVAGMALILARPPRPELRLQERGRDPA